MVLKLTPYSEYQAINGYLYNQFDSQPNTIGYIKLNRSLNIIMYYMSDYVYVYRVCISIVLQFIRWAFKFECKNVFTKKMCLCIYKNCILPAKFYLLFPTNDFALKKNSSGKV